MERLSFGSSSRYVAIESAIHMARYLEAKKFCAGKEVLDVACGAGYGSSLMASWGAKSVFGVDISSEAIQIAKESFSNERVEFLVGKGEELGQLCGKRTFDLIVSLETIEHVEDPAEFILQLRSVAKSNATIIISAPNDYWYYDHGGSNEFHKRKFTFQEFQDLTESILGKANSWSLGTLGIGFSVTRLNGALQSGNSSAPQELMLEYLTFDESICVPSQVESDTTSAECAFYVGVWGDETPPETIFVGYPVSMNLGRQPLFPRNGIWAIKGCDSELQRSKEELLEVVDSMQTNFEAVSSELSFLRAEHNEMRRNQESLNDELERSRDLLHFAEQEIKSLGMARRGAQSEVERLWTVLWRKNHELDELNSQIAGLSVSLGVAHDNTFTEQQKVLIAQQSITTLQQELAEIPWRIVGLWRRVRRFCPKLVLQLVGRIINFFSKCHAR